MLQKEQKATSQQPVDIDSLLSQGRTHLTFLTLGVTHPPLLPLILAIKEWLYVFAIKYVFFSNFVDYTDSTDSTGSTDSFDSTGCTVYTDPTNSTDSTDSINWF